MSDVKKSELDRKHHDVEASKKERLKRKGKANRVHNFKQGHGGKDGS